MFADKVTVSSLITVELISCIPNGQEKQIYVWEVHNLTLSKIYSLACLNIHTKINVMQK